MTKIRNPKGHIATLGTVPLAEGEKSRPVRIRAQGWVFEHLAGMSAAEVGNLIESALRGLGKQSGKTSAAPAVLLGTPELFPVAQKPQPQQAKKPAAARKPRPAKVPRPTAPAMPGATGPAVTPPNVDQMRVTGHKLTTSQALICAGLKLPGAVAEYDSYERRWMVGFAGAPAKQEDLEELARLGVLEVTGEGKGAVYRLAEKQPPAQQPQATKARKKLKAIGDSLPDTETFLRERRKDSRDDH